MHKYQILKDKQLMLWVIEGQIMINDHFSASCVDVLKEKDSMACSALIDTREATFYFNIEALIQFKDFMCNNNIFHKMKSVAFITNSPGQVVISTMMKTVSKSVLPDIRIVSTLEAGLNFLDITPGELSYFNELLLKMKKTSSEGAQYNSPGIAT